MIGGQTAVLRTVTVVSDVQQLEVALLPILTPCQPLGLVPVLRPCPEEDHPPDYTMQQESVWASRALSASLNMFPETLSRRWDSSEVVMNSPLRIALASLPPNKIGVLHQ